MDDDRFDEFYLHDYPAIVAAIAAVTGSLAEAQDAVDEATARAWEYAQRDRMPESIAAWVRVVALNLVRGRLRRRKAERRAVDRLNASARVPVGEPTSAGVDVRAALAHLSRRQREVAVLHYFCDLPVTEIATELGIAEGTVKSMLHRARVALGEVLSTEVSRDVQA